MRSASDLVVAHALLAPDVEAFLSGAINAREYVIRSRLAGEARVRSHLAAGHRAQARLAWTCGLAGALGCFAVSLLILAQEAGPAPVAALAVSGLGASGCLLGRLRTIRRP